MGANLLQLSSLCRTATTYRLVWYNTQMARSTPVTTSTTRIHIYTRPYHTIPVPYKTMRRTTRRRADIRANTKACADKQPTQSLRTGRARVCVPPVSSHAKVGWFAEWAKSRARAGKISASARTVANPSVLAIHARARARALPEGKKPRALDGVAQEQQAAYCYNCTAGMCVQHAGWQGYAHWLGYRIGNVNVQGRHAQRFRGMPATARRITVRRMPAADTLYLSTCAVQQAKHGPADTTRRKVLQPLHLKMCPTPQHYSSLRQRGAEKTRLTSATLCTHPTVRVVGTIRVVPRSARAHPAPTAPAPRLHGVQVVTSGGRARPRSPSNCAPSTTVPSRTTCLVEDRVAGVSNINVRGLSGGFHASMLTAWVGRVYARAVSFCKCIYIYIYIYVCVACCCRLGSCCVCTAINSCNTTALVRLMMCMSRVQHVCMARATPSSE